MRISELPFPFDVQGDPRAGGGASLRVQLAPPVEETRFDQLRCVVAWFAALGEFGALGGTSFAPGQSRALLPTGEPDSRSAAPVWQFAALAVDPAALSVLANLVLSTGLSVLRADLVAYGNTDPILHPSNVFPAPPPLRFQVQEDRTDRNVNVTLQFSADVPEALHDPLLDILRTWSMVAGLGGFREPGPLRDELGLVPEDEPEIVLDGLSFAFRDNGLPEGAYDVLLGVFAAFERHGAPVAEVTIE